MERRVAAILIQIFEQADIVRLNGILAKFGTIILGRQGINLPGKKFRIISLVVDATTDQIGALSGQIGRLPGIVVKTAILKPYCNGNDISS